MISFCIWSFLSLYLWFLTFSYILSVCFVFFSFLTPWNLIPCIFIMLFKWKQHHTTFMFNSFVLFKTKYFTFKIKITSLTYELLNVVLLSNKCIVWNVSMLHCFWWLNVLCMISILWTLLGIPQCHHRSSIWETVFCVSLKII